MMKVLLVALNSKYIHTNLAVRSLRAFAAERGYPSQIAEYTVNQHLPDLIDAIYRQHPDVLLLSCYIWNIEMAMQLAQEYRLICPDVKILAGGPEISYHSADMLQKNPALDGILCGEGEQAYLEYLQYLSCQRSIEQVHSLVWRDGERIVENAPAPLLDMAQLPFPYDDLEQLSNRILYFESIRGCPFRCSYCLSSVAGRVRYLPLELTFARLQKFLDAKVPQVKFVDRTFNCSKEHAMAVWKYLAAHDNGVTNFHFELTAHLIDREMIDFLSTVRPGLFQFEIGVQSTNPDTIREIRRTTDTDKLLSICRQLDAPKNIHLHLDLIAGLPFEDLESFRRSFDTVMQIRPQQMQLGFLKVLKGSYMEQAAPSYGLIYSQRPPFEVIRTNWISFDELLLLRDMENAVESYYNSCLFPAEISWMLDGESSAFDFFMDLGQWLVQRGLRLLPQGVEERSTNLKEFFLERHPERADQLQVLGDLCLFDLCLHARPKKIPCWAENGQNQLHQEQIRALLHSDQQLGALLHDPVQGGSKQLVKSLHLQFFSFDPLTRQKGPVALLFDYRQRDLLGYARFVRVQAEDFLLK